MYPANQRSVYQLTKRTLRGVSACVVGALVLCILACLTAAQRPAAAEADMPWRSPLNVQFSPDGSLLAVSDHTAARVYLLDVADSSIRAEVPLQGRPRGLVWSAGNRLFVAEYDAGTVAEVDADARTVVRRLTVGPKATGVAPVPGGGLLLVSDIGLNRVHALNAASGEEVAVLPMPREPACMVVTPDESLAVVANRLPAGPASDPTSSAAITLLDLENLEKLADIRLPDGSSNVRQVAVSPDGRWAYAVHTRGRVVLPTTQLERGWVNTNALSILDLENRSHYATVLLDRVTAGAADPWGIALSADGDTAWITLAGVHQVARIDLGRLHRLAEGDTDSIRDPEAYTGSGTMVWHKLAENPEENRELLSTHLAALYGPGLMRRTDLPVNGPRGIAVSPDGGRVAVAGYYSGGVLMLDPEDCTVTETIELGARPEASLARAGEIAFHDGDYSFQGWLSCATCHPEGRADGLNWDLLNDGIGNLKNTRSLLLADRTPPVMSRAVRPTYEAAVEAGFRYIQFHVPTPEREAAVKAYIRAMEPERSPYLMDGQLSEKAIRGKAIFESDETGCAGCHPGPLYTDLKTHDVGTRSRLDRAAEFDNPTLIELWRTGPYLHDGGAASLREVFTRFNPDDAHGRTSHLSDEEMDALVAYLLSL